MLNFFIRNFKIPLALLIKVIYNNSTVVESGAKCSEIPQKPQEYASSGGSEEKNGYPKGEAKRGDHRKTPKGGSKMLSGEFRHGIDPKNRLFIPSKHREELTLTDESFMVAKSIRENCLKVYSMSEWEEYISPIKRMERKDAERILRALHKDAATCPC